MRLRLFKAVQEAEERRDRARAMEAHPSNGTGPKAVERPPMGRPPVLTDAVLNTVVASLSAGDGRAAAAAAAGVTRRTFQRWMARGARVHFSGSVLTEYERLCLALYRRVKDVKMEQAQGAAEPVPTLEEKGLLDLSTVPRELLEQHLLSMPANPTLSILPRRGPEIAPRLDMGKLPPGTRFEPLSADAIKAGVISADAITTNRVAPVKPWPDVVIEIGRPRGPVRRWLLSLLERAARAL
jgi:hypothetical protein